MELVRGRRVGLAREDGDPPGTVRVELGWQPAPRRGLLSRRGPGTDLDASALLFAERQLADVVFFHHLASNDGSVRHNGDNHLQTPLGALPERPGHPEEESILVDLERVPAEISQIVFTVNSFTGQTFHDIALLRCRLVDAVAERELARYELPGGGADSGRVMAKLCRDDEAGWAVQAIGEPARGAGFQDILPSIAEYL